MLLLECSSPPASLRNNPINHYSKWVRWSTSSKQLLDKFARDSKNLSTPELIRLPETTEFNKTYGALWKEICALGCYNELCHMSWNLQSINPQNQILFCHNLLNDEFNSEHLHKLFAVLRTIIVNTNHHQMAAMYAPLGYVGRKAKDFPLHADLYVPNILWNIFEQVPRDGTGACTFIPASTFLGLLDSSNASLQHKAKLVSCLQDESSEDRFRTFYEMLYVNGDDWADQLCSQMRAKQFVVPLQYGDGYLLHDRKWLHGREAPSGGTNVKRVHRLIYLHKDSAAFLGPRPTNTFERASLTHKNISVPE